MAKKPTRGRIPLYKTAAELQKKIDAYFAGGMKLRTVMVGPPNNKRIEKIPVPTITGLVLYCGFTDRQSFYDLEKHPKFSRVIKVARSRIAQEYEEHLQCGLGAGAIFALKNFGWIDEHKLNGEGFKIVNIIHGTAPRSFNRSVRPEQPRGAKPAESDAS